MRRRGDSQMAKGAGFYWDCGRPRPQLPNTNLATVDLTLSEVIEKEVVSRFALIAGGGARGPSKAPRRPMLLYALPGDQRSSTLACQLA